MAPSPTTTTSAGVAISSCDAPGSRRERGDGREQVALAREHGEAGGLLVAAPADDAGAIDEELSDQLDLVALAVGPIALGRFEAVERIEDVARLAGRCGRPVE